MPHSQYVAGREPPTVWDRFLANPFVAIFSGISALVAASLLLSLHSAITVSRSLEGVTWWVLILLSSALLIGAYKAIRGTIWHKTGWSKVDPLRTEASGDAALALGYLAFGVSVLVSGNPYGTLVILISVGLGLSFGARTTAALVSVRRIERRLEAEKHLGG